MRFFMSPEPISPRSPVLADGALVGPLPRVDLLHMSNEVSVAGENETADLADRSLDLQHRSLSEHVTLPQTAFKRIKC